jgi:hypothetical protein
MKKLLLILLCLPMIGFGQDDVLENSKSKKISFDGAAGIGLGFVQDKNSPISYGKIGIGNEFFKLHLIASSNYLFFTRSDGSRKMAADKYAGLEWLMPSSSWGKDRGNDKWGGIGFNYCFENESELHNKQPIKAYVVYYFGIISVTAEYVWSDFSYPAISVRFEY